MICVAISKQRSIRFARMWNSRSPGVETAWRGPARISRNRWSSAGRGSPNSWSQAPDPVPITQERPASRSRNSTARINARRSAQNDRTAARLSGPGFIVTTRKIAARVSGADTGCATAIASISQRSFELAFDRSGQWLQRFARRVNQLYLCHSRLVFVKPGIAAQSSFPNETKARAYYPSRPRRSSRLTGRIYVSNSAGSCGIARGSRLPVRVIRIDLALPRPCPVRDPQGSRNVGDSAVRAK